MMEWIKRLTGMFKMSEECPYSKRCGYYRKKNCIKEYQYEWCGVYNNPLRLEGDARK